MDARKSLLSKSKKWNYVMLLMFMVSRRTKILTKPTVSFLLVGANTMTAVATLADMMGHRMTIHGIWGYLRVTEPTLHTPCMGF